MMGCMERMRDDIEDGARHEGLLGAEDAPGLPGTVPVEGRAAIPLSKKGWQSI